MCCEDEYLTLRYKNREEHIARCIAENVAQCEADGRECYILLRKMELEAFDLAFCSHLFGLYNQDFIYSFIERCIHPGFLLNTINPRIEEAFTVHVKFLEDVIEEAAAFLKSLDPQSKPICGSTTEFYLFLKNRLIEGEYSELFYEGEPVKRNTNDRTRKLKPTEQSPIANKWLQEEAKMAGRGVESLSSICLFRTITSRLCALSKIQEEISERQRIDENLGPLQFVDCRADDLFNSPFYRGLDEGIREIEELNVAIHEYQEIIRNHSEQTQERESRLNYSQEIEELESAIDKLTIPSQKPSELSADIEMIKRKIPTVFAGSDEAIKLQGQIDTYNAQKASNHTLTNQEEQLMIISQQKLQQIVQLLKQQSLSTSNITGLEHAKQKIKTLLSFDKGRDMDREIQEVQQRIKNISNRNYNLSRSLCEVKRQLREVDNDIYTAQKEAESSLEQRAVEKRISMITCRACRRRLPTRFITSCGHPLCAYCISFAKVKLCPICSKPYQEKDVIPFFVQ